VVDKTGTLTEGKPRVTAVIPTEGFEKDELLRLAASLERGSEHPLAGAILVAAQEGQLALGEVQEFNAPTGKGVTGVVDGRRVALGNAKLVTELGIDSGALTQRAEALRAEGATVVLAAVDGRIAGLLAMGHEILLLDEPTAGLDPVGEQRMMELLTSLNRDHGVTIVMATHSVDLVPLFLHRLHILDHGRVMTSGTPEEVFTTPKALAAVRLRLPHVAELFHLARHQDRLPFDSLPLTIGQARHLLAGTFFSDSEKRH